ncbi:MAG: PorV/PorQ family protein [Elusimicrobiota bacterium]
MTELNRKITAAALAIALACCPALSSAAGGPGTSAFQFLRLGVGARPAGMGEAFSGAAADIGAIYWNPAGLAGMERGELSMSHALWLEGITYSNIASGRPALGGTIGMAFNTLNSGDIQKADNSGARLAQNYDMADMMGIFSYARLWGELALGANLKYLSSRIEEESAHSCAVDIGAQYGGYRPWDRPLTLGLSVQNIGMAAKYVSEADPLPLIVRAGGSLELFNGLLAVLEVNYGEKAVHFRAGTEYARALGALVLAARAGYKDDTVRYLGALSGLTAGLGLKWNDYQLDYAWNSFTALGITHRISLSIKFDNPDEESERPREGMVSVLSL